MINNNLVGGWALALWKMMEWVTVGMMNFPFFIWKNPKKNSLNHYNPWNSQYMESQKIPWFQSPPTSELVEKKSGKMHALWVVSDNGIW